MPLKNKHLLGLENISKTEIEEIFSAAKSMKEILQRQLKKVPTLQGYTIANLFFENSTRTRISFDIAARRLSADVINFTASGSSMSKGETLKDTAKNIEAMKIDAVIVRHKVAGVPKFLSEVLKVKVINAGDGAHEHPTQGLLDAFTLKEKYGDLKKIRICLVGDIFHSRVARSNIFCLKTLGATVSVCGPSTLLPREIESLGVKYYYNVDEALKNSDAINVLRIQQERMESDRFPTLREYHQLYGITSERISKLKNKITVLHPGPINRDVEISADIADGEDSVILNQVENGVAIRMAVLYLICTNKN